VRHLTKKTTIKI